LSARILVLTGLAENVETARDLASSKLWSGEAMERFQKNVELQGGDPEVCDNPEMLWAGNLVETEINSPREGFITEIDAAQIGQAIGAIGGGRLKADDSIDHAVGYFCKCKIGDSVRADQTLGILFARNEAHADLVYAKLANAYKIEDENLSEQIRLIKEVVG
jgi:thymidine phosphorylase